MERKRKGLHVGTSGWSYPHWKGIFYPGQTKPAQYLEYYLTRFDCVELNASFYHLPRQSTVSGWVKRTPESFRFCPKLSRFITHQKRLGGTGEALERFLDRFGEMKSRLGPVLVQLPPGLRYDRSMVTDFFSLLNRHKDAYRFAIEIRHASWIRDDFFQLLSQYGISFVMADSGGRFPYHEAVTTDFVYLRFHGPAQLYASGYDPISLKGHAQKINSWQDDGLAAWVFFNNDFGGYAVKNAVSLIEMLYLL